jgi:ACS family tartrate transporter-like MFS transporter
MSALASSTVEVSAIERSTMRKISFRLVPFLMLCYIIAYLDRVNVGFAALQMNADLGLTAAMYGLGGGLFYIAYTLCEIPSNLILNKVGARVWIARIMITWGAVGLATAFITGAYGFYAVRLLLGAAEAGFFPGVILYLTYWYPAKYRARVVATFMVGIPLAVFVGSPISGGLLELNGVLGLKGWQWLFVAESIPAVLAGLAALLVLTERPKNAKWLSDEQRAWLSREMESEERVNRAVGHMPWWRLLGNKYVLVLGLVYAGSSATSNSLALWQPQILKAFGLTNMGTTLLNMIPFGLACIFMILWGRRADKSGEHVWNTCLPLALTAAALALTNFTGSLAITLVLLSLALIGNYAIKGPFWALATGWLSAGSAAAGIAMINTLAHVGTSITTWLIGVIKDKTGSFPMGLLSLVALTAVGAVAVVLLANSDKASRQVSASSPAE